MSCVLHRRNAAVIPILFSSQHKTFSSISFYLHASGFQITTNLHGTRKHNQSIYQSTINGRTRAASSQTHPEPRRNLDLSVSSSRGMKEKEHLSVWTHASPPTRSRSRIVVFLDKTECFSGNCLQNPDTLFQSSHVQQTALRKQTVQSFVSTQNVCFPQVSLNGREKKDSQVRDGPTSHTFNHRGVIASNWSSDIAT